MLLPPTARPMPQPPIISIAPAPKARGEGRIPRSARAGSPQTKPKSTKVAPSVPYSQKPAPEEFAVVTNRSHLPRAYSASASQVLATYDQQQAFCEAVVEHNGIQPAATAWGMGPSSVFWHAGQHPDFRKMLNCALCAVWEAQAFALNNLCEDLLHMDADERMKSANAYGKVFEYRMRLLGKLSPLMYGDRPPNQTLIQNNVGLVVDEETRERLINLREKMLTNETGSETTPRD